jgi:general secretion pathway protein G
MKRLRITQLRNGGFTLIELIIVMSIVGLLLTLAAPRYFKSIDRSKETVLKANLASTRDALDKFYSDTGKYPEQLSDLVDRKYLRTLPWDPILESATDWTIVPPTDNQGGAVYNIYSKAKETGANGIPYAKW